MNNYGLKLYFPEDRSPDELTMDAVASETLRARIKFPGNRFLLAALMEEVGELADALRLGKDKDSIDRECIQVAALAVRILEEGDSSDIKKSSLADLIGWVGSIARSLLQRWPPNGRSPYLASAERALQDLTILGDTSFTDVTDSEAKL
jgi:NTP pyrophosphatase (non-canonical NTP hydrolase)